MRKLIEFLKRLGIVEGITFRARVEDGVGIFIEPNPAPTRMHPLAVEVPAKPGRRQVRRASGHWVAKPLHIAW